MTPPKTKGLRKGILVSVIALMFIISIIPPVKSTDEVNCFVVLRDTVPEKNWVATSSIYTYIAYRNASSDYVYVRWTGDYGVSWSSPQTATTTVIDSDVSGFMIFGAENHLLLFYIYEDDTYMRGATIGAGGTPTWGNASIIGDGSLSLSSAEITESGDYVYFVNYLPGTLSGLIRINATDFTWVNVGTTSTIINPPYMLDIGDGVLLVSFTNPQSLRYNTYTIVGGWASFNSCSVTGSIAYSDTLGGVEDSWGFFPRCGYGASGTLLEIWGFYSDRLWNNATLETSGVRWAWIFGTETELRIFYYDTSNLLQQRTFNPDNSAWENKTEVTSLDNGAYVDFEWLVNGSLAYFELDEAGPNYYIKYRSLDFETAPSGNVIDTVTLSIGQQKTLIDMITTTMISGTRVNIDEIAITIGQNIKITLSNILLTITQNLKIDLPGLDFGISPYPEEPTETGIIALLVGLLPILFLLLIPTIIMGQYIGHIAVAPTFLFMGIICYVSGILPWGLPMLLVIILATVIIMFGDRVVRRGA